MDEAKDQILQAEMTEHLGADPQEERGPERPPEWLLLAWQTHLPV